MTDDEYRGLVLQHDKHIDRLAQSIEHIAGAMGSTNRKLEDVLEVISQQNVLMEKFSNLEVNLKESFGRVHDKLKHVETVQNKNGCLVLQAVDARVESLEEDAKDGLRPITLKTLLYSMITALITYGAYNEHRINVLTTNITTLEQSIKYQEDRIKECEMQTKYLTGRIK